MDVMRTMPDKAFDLAIVDPPYGIGADKPSEKPCMVKQKNGEFLRVDNPEYKHKYWDNIPTEDYFKELFRVSQNQIIWGVNYYSYSLFAGGRIVWDKLNYGSDQYDCEIAYCSYNNRTDMIYYMWRGMIQGLRCCKDVKIALEQQGNKSINEKRIHPTQKPVKLYKWLLGNYANSGDKILDTHLGSGSICIACDDLGFEMTGIELDPDYYDAARQRLINHQAQQKLF